MIPFFSKKTFQTFSAGTVAFVVIFSLCVPIPREYRNWTQRQLSGNRHTPSKTDTTSLFPLFRPFSSSPSPGEGPQWLLTVFTSARKQLRRQIIRETWQKLYAKPNAYEFRFVLGNWSSIWDPVIAAENATYGDIWCMSDFMDETSKTANTVKPMEWWKYLIRYQNTKYRRYKFVSKVDDDSFLNMPSIYEEYMRPRLLGLKNNTRTLIGRPMSWGRPYEYTSGRFYTVSWDLIELYAHLFTAHPIYEEAEDVLTGRVPYENNQAYNLIPMDDYRAFDIGWEGLVGRDSLVVHSMKDDERYLEVASLFNKTGYNGKLVHGLTSYNRTMKETVHRKGEYTEKERQNEEMEKKKKMEKMERIKQQMIKDGHKVENVEAKADEQMMEDRREKADQEEGDKGGDRNEMEEVESEPISGTKKIEGKVKGDSSTAEEISQDEQDDDVWYKPADGVSPFAVDDTDMDFR